VDPTERVRENARMRIYEISGMTCANCVRHVTEAISSVPGVTSVVVDLDAGQARVEGEVDDAQVFAAVEAAGYTATA
jgi:copper chaperone CopZ